MVRPPEAPLAPPGVELADCPTATDMAGDVVTWDAGLPELYRGYSEDAAVVIRDIGAAARLHADPVPATRYVYGACAADLPVPGPDDSARVEAEVTTDDGTHVAAQETCGGPWQAAAIGACGFDASEITHGYGDGTFRNGAVHLPEPGLFVWPNCGTDQRGSLTPLTIATAP